MTTNDDMRSQVGTVAAAQGQDRLPAWEPFQMPTLEPLARQQGLLFEQSELLKQQFLKFGDAMKKLYVSIERLRDDLGAERQQRVQGQDQGASALAALRAEAEAERRKHETSVKQVDERLIGLREEVVSHARAYDGDVQRMNARAENLALELGVQLTALRDKQEEMAERLQAEIHDALDNERNGTKTLVSALREEIRQALEGSESSANQQQQVLSQRLEEECLGGLRAQETRREYTEIALKEALRAESDAWQKALSAQRQDVLELLSAEARRWGLALEGVERKTCEASDRCCALSKTEAEAQAEAVGLRHAVSLRTELSTQVSEIKLATATLSDALTKDTLAMTERNSEFEASLEATMSHGWDSASLGREELWHVMSAVQDQAANIAGELQELTARTTTVEVKRLGEVSVQLEELTSVQDEMTARFQSLEHLSLKENVRLTSRLDECTCDLERTKETVSKFGGGRDFLESKNSQYRVYVTPDGDLAVFPRNDWGKWGSDYSGVPCWHAGCGDRQLISVNREMQAHEKDRYLAAANRDEASLNERLIMQ